MKLLHTQNTFVSFGDTDASGRIYYANIYGLAHKAFEEFAIQSSKYQNWFNNSEWTTPVRHSEAEYISELRSGYEVKIDLYIGKIGNTSFTWYFEIFHKDKIAAKVSVTHVTVDLKTGKACPVPEELKALV